MPTASSGSGCGALARANCILPCAPRVGSVAVVEVSHIELLEVPKLTYA
jgi:hypothetical protein